MIRCKSFATFVFASKHTFWVLTGYALMIPVNRHKASFGAEITKLIFRIFTLAGAEGVTFFYGAVFVKYSVLTQ